VNKQTSDHGELTAVKQASSEDERASSKDGQGNHECWPNLTLLFIFCTRFKSFRAKWEAGFHITSMSNQVIWADAIIIQAVTDNLKLKIHITESLPNFAELTVVEAATPQQQLSTIYIGHLDEFHYVSTKHLVPYICPLKRGTQEVPADAPKTAKQQCTFDLSLHNNSG